MTCVNSNHFANSNTTDNERQSLVFLTHSQSANICLI